MRSASSLNSVGTTHDFCFTVLPTIQHAFDSAIPMRVERGWTNNGHDPFSPSACGAASGYTKHPGSTPRRPKKRPSHAASLPETRHCTSKCTAATAIAQNIYIYIYIYSEIPPSLCMHPSDNDSASVDGRATYAHPSGPKLFILLHCPRCD